MIRYDITAFVIAVHISRGPLTFWVRGQGNVYARN